MNWIYDPWPWYVSGPMIAFIMFLLIIVGKNFGMSANLRTMCTMCGADKRAEFFKFDWKAQRWNLVVVIGTIIGGYIAANYLTTDPAVHISADTIEELKSYGFETAGAAYAPDKFFSMSVFSDPKYLGLLIIGGLLIGFGSRYAGGCTSGHAISGLSNLQLPSLIATIGFFIGGLIMVYLLYPIIF
ncbi:YeeE/YedE family protein [Aegicerativicinus sediminis]|uniref:YeeE/YedE family protein n=1 Tax=Aegicerativicinus sediminis TaxID=2893202 RepID=UPI001E3DC910|nr:YeeE/YedE thiosulfate transporter family protein [Aegicerativicinus sediminis]